MIGLVLAAGAGTRLGAETAELPKTLLGVDGDRTILDVALGNFRRVGLEQAVVVTGYAHERLAERVPALERRHGLRIELVYNPRALEWNNAYSLWCARDALAEGVLLANGDTVHPASVEETLLEARGPELLIAVDDSKPLGEEEMKVHVTAEGSSGPHPQGARPGDRARRVHRRVADRAGGGGAARRRAWRPPGGATRRSTTRTASRSSPTAAAASAIAPIGSVEWVEVDDRRDLERAREVACRC